MQFEIFDPGPIKIQPGEVAKLNRSVSELYVGQILKTVVVKAINDHTVMLNINGNNINAQTAHKYQPGQKLEVVVQKQGDSIILKVQQNAIPTVAIQKALSQYITQQLPANQTMTQLVRWLQNNQLPQPLQQQLQSWIQSLPTLGQLSHALPSVIAQSGLFFENKLKKSLNEGSVSLKNDVKGLLWSLLAESEDVGQPHSPNPNSLQKNANPAYAPLPFPGALPQPFIALEQNLYDDALSLGEQLHHLAKAALARMTSLQLTQLATQQQQSGYQILIDLPFLVNEEVEIIPLLIKKMPHLDDNFAATWRAQFALNLSHIGPIQVSIELTYKSLSIESFVESPSTKTALENMEPFVTNWSREQGLILNRWQVTLGLQKNDFSDHTYSMVDIKL